MSNQISSSKLGNAGFEGLSRSKKPMTRVEVEIRPSEVFSAAVRYTIMSANRIFRESVNSPIVEEELLHRYYLVALKQRILKVLGAKIPETVKVQSSDYPLPSVVYNAIRQIGEAKDVSFNIRFIPVLSPELEAVEPLSMEDYETCVNFMRAMEEEGYVVSGPLSRDIYGDINFMALTNLDNVSNGPMAYRDINPTYAFYRAFFYNQELARLATGMYIYQYNSMDEMSNVLKDILFRKVNINSVSDVVEEYKA